MRDGHEGHVAYCRVLADDEDEVAVVDVRQRVQRAGAEHGFAAGELVGAVLSSRAEMLAGAELTHEAAERRAEQRVEGRRVPRVAADGACAVTIQDRLETLGDLGQSLLPTDGLEAAGRHAL